MRNNTTTRATGQTVRRWPAWKLNERLRQSGLNHLDIARRAKVSETLVSHTIRRRRVNGEAVGRVWAALELALT